MAAPIFVINYCIKGLSDKQMINHLKSIQRVIEQSGANDEYYTFVLPVISESNIQVFYEKDYDEIKHNELVSMIENKFQILEKQLKIKKKRFFNRK